MLTSAELVAELAKCSTMVDFHKLGLRAGFELETEFTDDCQCEDTGPEYLSGVPDGLECKEDGSVDGYEFVVEGDGCTPAKFLRLSKELFTTMDHVVSTNCSFHVHVSLPGPHWTRLKFALQPFATEYLIDRFHELPAFMQQRRRDGKLQAWAQPFTTDLTSHSHAVSPTSHGTGGTLEFRLWGNVSNHADAKICLEWTLKALAYAAQQVEFRAVPISVMFGSPVEERRMVHTRLYSPNLPPIRVLLRDLRLEHKTAAEMVARDAAREGKPQSMVDKIRGRRRPVIRGTR